MIELKDLDNLHETNKKWVSEINNRVKKLRNCRFYLEAFYLFVQVVESRLKEVILLQEYWVEVILRKYNLSLNIDHLKKLDNKTLGDIIKIFDHYCPNKDLIKELNKLSSFRNKIVHHLIDHRLEDVNNESEKFYRNFFEIIIDISRYEIKIYKDILKNSKKELNKINKKIKIAEMG